MEMQLKGKVAVVTAASAGLGKAVAMELAKEGASLYICSRDAERIRAAAEEISKQTGTEVRYAAKDVSQAHAAKEIIDEAAEAFGKLDILITNAGGPPVKKFMQLTDEDWSRAIDLNLLSVIRLVREAVPYLRQSDTARIVNIASTSVKQPIPNLVLSNTLRTGLLSLFKTLSMELADDRILVNTASPGSIATGRIASMVKQRSEETGMSEGEIRAEAFKSIPLGRYGEPEEFAKAVVFLASPVNSYITGHCLFVDGGVVKSI